MKIFILVIHPDEWGDDSSEVRGAYSTLEAAIHDGKQHGPASMESWHIEEYILNVFNSAAPVPYRYE